jgi:hypothetical protein
MWRHVVWFMFQMNALPPSSGSKIKLKNLQVAYRKIYSTELYVITLFIILLVGYLTPLSVSRLHSVDEKMINECRAGGGMKTGRGNRSTRIKHVPNHSVHQTNPTLTWCGIEPTVENLRLTNRRSCGTALHGDTYSLPWPLWELYEAAQRILTDLDCPRTFVPKATRSPEMLSCLYGILWEMSLASDRSLLLDLAPKGWLEGWVKSAEPANPVSYEPNTIPKNAPNRSYTNLNEIHM